MGKSDPDSSLGKPLITANLAGMGGQIAACFEPLGLQRESRMGSWKFNGEVNGRTVEVTVAVRTRNRYLSSSISYRKFTGLWMSVSVSTPVMSRLTVGQPGGLGRRVASFTQRLYGSKPVTNVPNLFENLFASAHDPVWAEAFLANLAVQKHLMALMQSPDLPTGAAVILGPGKWQWSTPALPGDFTPEAAQRWIGSLASLAALSEQSPPMTAVQPNWLERQNSTVVSYVIAIAFLFGIPLMLFACCMVPALLLILLNSN